MLQINDLSLSFGGQALLDEISFNLHSGERIGLVGRNGSGKTTLFRLITGEVRPDEGRISLPKNYTIGYLQQHLRFSEPTVLQEACLGLRAEEKDQVWKAEKILTGLGFSPEEHYKSPAEFSGGFQVRLNLAKVLLAEPHLLLLDEPTNYLDIVSIRWFTRFLQRWPSELMLITHDRDFMNSVTTHTMAIHRRKIKKIAGDTAKLFEQIAVEEEVYEKTRQKEEKKREETIEFINRFRALAARASLVQSRVKALEKMGQKQELAKVMDLGFRFNSLAFPAKQLMRVKEISFGYTPERTLIEDFSLDIGKKDRICVVGKNGKGKSTLLRLLAGELAPQSGQITNHADCRIGYFGQTNIERLDPNLTIEQEFTRLRPDLKYGDIRKTCGAMMFGGDLALKSISILSGGEKSRVSLGKILLAPTNLLLLDEPTNHLDVESCDSLIAAIDDFPGAVIIVTHSEMFLHHLAKRLIVFSEERAALFEGTYQDFLDRVGWEPAVKKPKKEKGAAPAQRARAAREAAEQKKRSTLLAKIAAVEKMIEDEEAKAHADQAIIDAGYAELEKLIAELDIIDQSQP